MPYLKSYDQIFDELIQVEISAETVSAYLATKGANPASVSDTPFEGIQIGSRSRSVRHPGWADEDPEEED